MDLLTIVEGDGEIAAVPALVRQVLTVHHRYDVSILKPHRRGEWPKAKKEFDRFFEVAMIEGAPILWVLDFDCDECLSVEDEVSWALDRARRIRNDVHFEMCFMVKEFESLFLADEGTTRSVFPDIPESFHFPADPEAVRDAKGWLAAARPSGSTYKPTMHQAKIAAQLNVAVLRERSPSFARFETSLLRLVNA